MPVTIKPSQLKYKDPSTSQYVSVAAVADLSNIPVASYLNAGIIKTNTDFGTNMRDAPNQDTLMVVKADSANIKAATQKWKPIVPYHQHESVFYGLAKAAGDSTQSVSLNAVGIYTDNAKSAIQNMLDVPSATNTHLTGIFTLGSRDDTIVGQNSVSFGSTNLVAGAGGFSVGYHNYVYGSSSQAFGAYCVSSGNGSTTFGYGSVTEWNDAFTVGHYNYRYITEGSWQSGTSYEVGQTVNYGTQVLQCINANSETESPSTVNWIEVPSKSFIVGNGTENTRSNALTLESSGKLSIKDYIYVGANADGSGGTRIPHDIQINGTSIVSNGIATIPIASDGTFGVIKTREFTDGFKFDSNNNLQLAGAADTQIKAGTTNYRAITPYVQHYSVFYGLATAAGDSTQSASSNAVGIYTDSAKVQIQKMIGNYEPDYVLVNDITLTEETTLDLTTTDDNVAYNFRNVYIYIHYPADTASVASGYDRYRFYDSSNTFIVAETRKYTTKTLNNFKHIHLIRKSNMTLVEYTWQANTGDSGNWNIKAYPDGIRFGMGNITRIMMPDADAEPAGTRIRIFAQWAY